MEISLAPEIPAAGRYGANIEIESNYDLLEVDWQAVVGNHLKIGSGGRGDTIELEGLESPNRIVLTIRRVDNGKESATVLISDADLTPE